MESEASSQQSENDDDMLVKRLTPSSGTDGESEAVRHKTKRQQVRKQIKDEEQALDTQKKKIQGGSVPPLRGQTQEQQPGAVWVDGPGINDAIIEAPTNEVEEFSQNDITSQQQGDVVVPIAFKVSSSRTLVSGSKGPLVRAERPKDPYCMCFGSKMDLSKRWILVTALLLKITIVGMVTFFLTQNRNETTKPSLAPSSYLRSFKATPAPSLSPSELPTVMPTQSPSHVSSQTPSTYPTAVPSQSPTHFPSNEPSAFPTARPSLEPTTTAPTECSRVCKRIFITSIFMDTDFYGLFDDENVELKFSINGKVVIDGTFPSDTLVHFDTTTPYPQIGNLYPTDSVTFHAREDDSGLGFFNPDDIADATLWPGQWYRPQTDPYVNQFHLIGSCPEDDWKITYRVTAECCF